MAAHRSPPPSAAARPCGPAQAASVERAPVAGEEGSLLAALLFAALAGYVDAIGCLQLGGLFVSFMSGNTTLFAISLAQASWPAALSGALVIGAFTVGAFVGVLAAAAAQHMARAAPAPKAAIWPFIFAVETVLIGLTLAFAASGHADVPHMLPLVLAMGMQNELRQSVGGEKLGATFVTGTLVSLGRAAALGLLGRGSGWYLHALGWLALAGGALLGGLAFSMAGLVPALSGAAAATFVMFGAGLMAARRRNRCEAADSGSAPA